MFAFRSSSGFSLVELIVVIAIIGLLAALAMPTLSLMGQARGVSEAAYELASAVDLARSEAIARQTFVWLCMQPQINSGNLGLRVGMVYSKDGTTNTNAANLQPIGRALLIQRVGLANTADLHVAASLSSAIDLSGVSGGVSFRIGQTNFDSKRTITFTPLGEVTTNAAPSSASGFDPRLAVGLRQANGTTLMTSNDIAVAIDGSVGIPTIYRK